MFRVLLIALALAMDCFTVSVTCGIVDRSPLLKRILFTAFMFGLFQALMPLLGWMGVSSFSTVFQQYDHWIAFSLLSVLGIKMILDALRAPNEERSIDPSRLSTIITMAIATSVDAFAVGLSLGCIGVGGRASTLMAIAVIGIVSFLLSVVGYLIGIYTKRRVKLPMEPVGGAILIIIGVRILIEHLS